MRFATVCCTCYNPLHPDENFSPPDENFSSEKKFFSLDSRRPPCYIIRLTSDFRRDVKKMSRICRASAKPFGPKALLGASEISSSIFLKNIFHLTGFCRRGANHCTTLQHTVQGTVQHCNTAKCTTLQPTPNKGAKSVHFNVYYTLQYLHSCSTSVQHCCK